MDANDTANAASERIDAAEAASDPPRYNLRPRGGREEVAEEDTRQGLNVTDGLGRRTGATVLISGVDAKTSPLRHEPASGADRGRSPDRREVPSQLIGKGERRAGRVMLGLNSPALPVRQWVLESYSTRPPLLMQARTSRLLERSVKGKRRCHEATCLASHRQRIQCAARTEGKTERRAVRTVTVHLLCLRI